MRRGRLFVVTLGVTALAAGGAVVTRPELVPPIVGDIVTFVGGGFVVAVAVLLLAVYALWRYIASSPAPVQTLVEDPSGGGGNAGGLGDGGVPPEVGATSVLSDSTTLPDAAVRSEHSNRPGATFDRAFAANLHSLRAHDRRSFVDDDTVRRRLRESVVTVRTHDGGRSAEAVEAELADGTWTDDRIAAAFLGGSDAPDAPLARRLYAWLYPDRAYRRRVERVAVEVERQTDRAMRVGGDAE